MVSPRYFHHPLANDAARVYRSPVVGTWLFAQRSSPAVAGVTFSQPYGVAFVKATARPADLASSFFPLQAKCRRELLQFRLERRRCVVDSSRHLFTRRAYTLCSSKGSNGSENARVVISAVGSRAQDISVEAPGMAFPETLPVVSADWLMQHVGDDTVKVLDGSWYMPAEKRSPLQEYQEGHIPGATFFDVDGIVDPTSELPHMLPTEVAFSAAVSALGLKNNDKIVVYDGTGIFSAARVWWMFRVFGHENVCVLDGGLPQWRAKTYPVEAGVSVEALKRISAASEAVKRTYKSEKVDSHSFEAHLQQYLLWSKEQVQRNIAEKKYKLVDARSTGRFDGSVPEPRKGVRGGHVPGSTCVPFPQVLTSSGTLLSPEILSQKFQDAGVSLDSPIAVSCGTGVTACVLALALHRLGRQDVPVYDGSWTEWGMSPDLPVEKRV